MKKYYRFITVWLLLHSGFGFAGNTGTFIVELGLDTDHVSRVQARFYSDALSYVNGGITITYPTSFFNNTPSILITIELTGLAYSTEQLVVAEVTANSATSAMVRVNVYDGLVISEAATGDVKVHFRAVGQ